MGDSKSTAQSHNVTRSGSRRLREFDPKSFSWEEWEIFFDAYVAGEKIKDETEKRDLLITSMADQPFKTLVAICKPEKPTNCSYDELLEKLRSNYARVTFVATEQIKFFSKRQTASQTITDFANDLRDKATACAFPAVYYEQALITAFVGGLNNDQVRKHLMQRHLRTFEETLNAAKTTESVLTEGVQARQQSSEELMVNKVKYRYKSSKETNTSKTTCSSCGSSDHLRSNCRFRQASCHKCHKQGHIAKVCKSVGHLKKANVNSVRSYTVKQTNDIGSIVISLSLGNKKVKFQLDTGSSWSLITEQTWSEIGQPVLDFCPMKLNSFTGHSIQLKGQSMLDVLWDGEHFRLTALVAKGATTNLLGLDWIKTLRLDTKSLNEIRSESVVAKLSNETKSLDELFVQYHDIFKGDLGCCKIKAHLHIKPDATPSFCKPRSLPFAYRQAVEDDLNRLIETKVLSPISCSKWAAPVVIVPKPGGKVRICADLSTGVNRALNINQYPLPRPDELFVALNGGCSFTKIDFSDAYHQVELDDSSKEILVINTHKGLFQYNRLPFGVASAPSIFQQIMDQMLAGLNGAVCYLDDIIVTGKSETEHLRNLQSVFQRIQEYGFRVNKSKCCFLQDKVEYLGFIVDKNGVHTSPSKIKAIVDMPKPVNISQLRSYLGMINHYSKFVSRLTDRLKPFYKLLVKDSEWIWNDECEKAFKVIKKILSSPIALAHYDPSLPLFLAADASNTGIGAVIYHKYPDGSEKPIAHASKTLTQTEQKYAQIEKEALALVYGIQKFDQFTRGRRFTLLTDHKPLLSIFGSKKGIPLMSANRLQRWALRLMGYSFDLEYRSTHIFGQADGLSRLPVGPDKQFDDQDPGENQVIALVQQELQSDLPIRASQVAEAIKKDQVLNKVFRYALSDWPSSTMISSDLQPYYRIREELTTGHGCLLWGFRTIIPFVFRKKLLDHLHSTHSGMGRMKSEARRYFWWPSLDNDIEQLVRQCKTCTENSKQPAKVPLQQWNIPQVPWQRIHIDFMGKFMDRYFLIIVDAHSKWLEVIPMNVITSKTTIDALISLFARYGLCQEIVSDNGTQFTSEEFAAFCGRHGIRHIRTSPGHPQSNGQAERYVDIVKTALTKGSTNGGNISEVLNKFLFRYRSTTHATTNASPAELFLKRDFRTVLDLLRPDPQDMSNVARSRYKRNFDKHTKTRIFHPKDKVLVRDLRQGSEKVKWTPGVLVNRSGSNIWDVKVSNGICRRHEDQMKHRYWSTTEDFLILDSTSTSVEPAVQPAISQNPPDLRRSNRVKKPVRRLIEEI